SDGPPCRPGRTDMSALLQVKDVESYYGPSQALFGISFEVQEREVVTLIGRNGMGKSTTVKSVMGMIAPKRGSIHLGGAEITGPLLRLADRHFIVEKGRVVWSGSSETLRAQPNLLHEYVGV